MTDRKLNKAKSLFEIYDELGEEQNLLIEIDGVTVKEENKAQWKELQDQKLSILEEATK